MKKILFALLATVSLKGFEVPQEKSVPSSIVRAAAFLDTCEKTPQTTKAKINHVLALLTSNDDYVVPQLSGKKLSTKTGPYTTTCGYCRQDLGTDPVDAFYHLRPSQERAYIPACPIRHPLIAKQQKIRRQQIVPQLFSPDSLYCDEEI